MEKKCYQISDGPTPCFRETGFSICSLSYCPVEEMLKRNSSLSVHKLLHSHCVMSDSYNRQTDFTEGGLEFIAAIARIGL